MRSSILILSLLLSLSSIKAEDNFWVLISMVPPRGFVWNFICNKSNDIFLSSSNGVFKSTNKGESWNWSLTERTTPVIICDNGYLFARRMTKKIANEFYSYYSLFRSTENGDSWIELEKFWNDSLNLFHITNDKNDILISLNEYYGNYNIYYYKSTDFGISWEKTGSFNNDTIKLSYNFYSVNGLLFQLGYEDSNGWLLKSTDMGKSWTIKNINVSHLLQLYIKSIDEFYLSTETGVYTSTDQGDSWTLKWLPKTRVYNIQFLDNNTIIATTQKGLYVSNDGGLNWFNHSSFNEINKKNLWTWSLFSDLDANLYTSPFTYGVYSSYNNGNDWIESNKGFSGFPANDITFTKTDMLISSWGMFRSEDIGINWDYLGLKGYELGDIVVNSKGHIFVGDLGTGSTQKGVFRSTDNGVTWSNSDSGTLSVFTLMINSKDMLFKTNGSAYISRSTNDGETWHYPNNVVGTKLGINDEGDIFSFSNGTIYRSTDDGVNWEKVFEMALDIIYTDRLGGRIIFNNKTKTAWYGDFTNIDNTFTGSVKTTDNGRTWFKDTIETIGLNPENIAVDSIYCWITAIDNKGIFRSCDNGITWQKLDTSGLKHKEFGPIAVSPDGYIYIFGGTGGLYRSTQRFVSVREGTQKQFELFNNPNPFTELTEILINLPEPAQLQFSVYDIMGIEVFNKDYGWTESGASTILFDGQGFPSGIYYYRVCAGSSVFTGNMVLLN